MKRECSQFRGCGFIKYDILNGKLDVSAPFSNFELGMLRHLRVSTSQLHHLSWAFVKVFQVCCEYKGRRPILRLFFTLFEVYPANEVKFHSWVKLY